MSNSEEENPSDVPISAKIVILAIIIIVVFALEWIIGKLW